MHCLDTSPPRRQYSCPFRSPSASFLLGGPRDRRYLVNETVSHSGRGVNEIRLERSFPSLPASSIWTISEPPRVKSPRSSPWQRVLRLPVDSLVHRRLLPAAAGRRGRRRRRRGFTHEALERGDYRRGLLRGGIRGDDRELGTAVHASRMPQRPA